MKRLISIVVSLTILVVIYWKIDITKLLPVFANCDPFWMTVSLAMVVPLTLCTAWRLQQLMPQRGQLPFGEANRLILVASVLNLVLPSKMGDIAKAYFMRELSQMSGALSLSLVVFEKATDMLSLLWWCVFGLAWIKLSGAQALDSFAPPEFFAPLFQTLGLSPRAAVFWLIAGIIGGALIFGTLLIGSTVFARLFFGTAIRFAPAKLGGKLTRLQEAWAEMHSYFWKSKPQLALVATTSLFIWFLHLLQIWLFILALRASTPFLANLALSPLAILAGLLPLTFAGVGTRDAALVILYAPYFSAPVAAALGLLCTARYVLPALGGAPFAPAYFRIVGNLRRKAVAGSSPTL